MHQRLLWLHANYDQRRLRRSLYCAEAFLNKIRWRGETLLVSVDNGHANGNTETHRGSTGREKWHLLPGSNVAREFSAWHEGWSHAIELGFDADITVLTNDTFPYHHPFRLLLGPLLALKLRKLLRTRSERWALGVAERGYSFKGLPEYLSSFFVVLDRHAAIAAMRDICVPYSSWKLVGELQGQVLVLSTDESYANHVNKWLLSRSTLSWYGAEPLTESNIGMMRGKARSIILEHSLSRRLLETNIKLVSCFDYAFPADVLSRWMYRLLTNSPRALLQILGNKVRGLVS